MQEKSIQRPYCPYKITNLSLTHIVVSFLFIGSFPSENEGLEEPKRRTSTDVEVGNKKLLKFTSKHLTNSSGVLNFLIAHVDNF